MSTAGSVGLLAGAGTFQSWLLSRLSGPLWPSLAALLAVLLAGEVVFRRWGCSEARASRLVLSLGLPLSCGAALQEGGLGAWPGVLVAQALFAGRFFAAHRMTDLGWVAVATALGGLGMGRWGAGRLGRSAALRGRWLLSEWTRFQRVEVVEAGQSLQLYIDGHLQFDTADERHYHEALVRPVVQAPSVRRVLVLGGGDGLAARTLLELRSEVEVTLVDIDGAMLELFTRHPRLRALNGGALKSPQVRCVVQDARRFLETTDQTFDAAILDLPDPDAPGMERLYVPQLMADLERCLRGPAVVVSQAGNAQLEPGSLRRVRELLERSGRGVAVYSAPVPSFGGEATFVATA